jgi:hypothetical protein
MEFVKAASARRLLRWRSTLTRPKTTATTWMCSSCRARNVAGAILSGPRHYSSQLSVSSTVPSDKPFYVTTPIFYVNAGMCPAWKVRAVATRGGAQHADPSRSSSPRAHVLDDSGRYLQAMADIAWATSLPMYGNWWARNEGATGCFSERHGT